MKKPLFLVAPSVAGNSMKEKPIVVKNHFVCGPVRDSQFLGGLTNRHSLERFATFEVHMAQDKPVQEVRIQSVKATVWKNQTEKNGVRFNTTFKRLYRDAEGWQKTDSFGRDDLLVLAKVADQVHSWIVAQPHDEEKSAAEKPVTK